MVATIKRLVVAVLATALVVAFTPVSGVQTAQAAATVDKVEIACDIDSVGLLPTSKESEVQYNLRHKSKDMTGSITIDTVNTFLMYYHETDDHLYGIGTGTNNVDPKKSYYVSYSLEPEGAADWPDAVKTLKVNSEVSILTMPELSVWFGGYERSDCYLAYNSAYNTLIVMIPIWNHIDAQVSGTQFTYNGKVQKPTVSSVSVVSGASVPSEYYRVRYFNGDRDELIPKDAGTYWLIIEGEGIYDSTYEWKFTINKASNPLKVAGKTATIKYKKLKKKTQKLSVKKIIKFKKKASDPKKYKLSSVKKGSKSFKKYFKLNSKTGKLTVKKGLKKGTYKIKMKLKGKGNKNHKASTWKKVTSKVKVK